MISTIYILTKLEDDWYNLRCYEGYENHYEIVWSYNGSKDAVNYECFLLEQKRNWCDNKRKELLK